MKNEPLTNGRKTNGQFAKGNPGGPGNPYARRVAKLRSTMIEVVGDKGIEQIVRTLIKAANGGDVAAAKLLLSYTLGRPVETIHPDALDIHEQELKRQIKSDSTSVFIDDEARKRIQRIVDAADHIDEDWGQCEEDPPVGLPDDPDLM